jgi:arylformamidase
MAAALRPRTHAVEIVEAERNHFDLPYDLGVKDTELGDAVLAQMSGLAT